jgi:hypothetical protein
MIHCIKKKQKHEHRRSPDDHSLHGFQISRNSQLLSLLWNRATFVENKNSLTCSQEPSIKTLPRGGDTASEHFAARHTCGSGGSQTHRTLKSVVDFLRMDLILMAEGSILESS